MPLRDPGRASLLASRVPVLARRDFGELNRAEPRPHGIKQGHLDPQPTNLP